MVVNGRPLKRMKRRVTAELNDFFTFPAGESVPAGPFRSTVREFLQGHARVPSPSFLLPHLMTWRIRLRVGEMGSDGDGGAAVCLDVVEEDVIRSKSVYCDQCRVVGWSGNPVCGKRYHFIIKGDGGSLGGYNKSCAACGHSLHLSDSRCKSCHHAVTTEDYEDWMYHQLEDTSHLLHGVVHANGYGHLLRVNGREGGSRVLSGCHIMDFWDRLCKVLGVRRVSVMDVSKKYGLEFRLLHSIMKGHPWYGDWGYDFGAGSYAITYDAYKNAIKTLSNLPLSIFFSQGRKPRTRLQDLITFYQSLSDQELLTTRDLFCSIMTLIDDAHKSNNTNTIVDNDNDNTNAKKVKSCDSRVLCAWNTGDIIRVEEAMFRVLRAVTGFSWVSWRSLRGAVCRVGRPELLDYCLKELKGKQAADGMLVNARCNPESGAIEYRLEPGNAPANNGSTNSSIANCPSEDHLLRDLRYFYETLLHPRSMMNHIPTLRRDEAISSSMILLDCKQFVKNYHPECLFPKTNPYALTLSCNLDLEESTINPPPEHIILSHNATILDLKMEASKAFQEVYVMLKRFQVEELVGYRGVDESTQIKLLLGSATEAVSVRGNCKGTVSRYRMERGVETWTLDCGCGAKDDDGERMLACDVCGVWQHTRCAGIPDSNTVPAKFVCNRCGGGGFGGGSGGGSGGDVAKTSLCKDIEMMDSVGRVGGVMDVNG